MAVPVVKALVKTFYYGCFCMAQPEKSHIDVKKKWAMMILKTLGYDLKIYGNPPPQSKDRSYVLVGNHISYLDIPVLMAALPEATFIAKDNIKRWPLIGVVAAAVGTVFVNRNGSNHRVLKNKVFPLLNRKDRKLVVFPSGTTTLAEEIPWKKGIFEIAKRAEIPIQLFRIDYSPLRASAYIDNDNLLVQVAGLSKIKNKTASLTWIDQFDPKGDSVLFSEYLRKKVTSEELVQSIQLASVVQ